MAFVKVPLPREMLRPSLELVLIWQVVVWWDAVGFHCRKSGKKRSLGTSGDGCTMVGIQRRKELKAVERPQILLLGCLCCAALLCPYYITHHFMTFTSSHESHQLISVNSYLVYRTQVNGF